MLTDQATGFQLGFSFFQESAICLSFAEASFQATSGSVFLIKISWKRVLSTAGLLQTCPDHGQMFVNFSNLPLFMAPIASVVFVADGTRSASVSTQSPCFFM